MENPSGRILQDLVNPGLIKIVPSKRSNLKMIVDCLPPEESIYHPRRSADNKGKSELIIRKNFPSTLELTSVLIGHTHNRLHWLP